MSIWKRLVEAIGEANYTPGMRRNSIWNRADDASRTRAPDQAKAPQAKGPKPPASGPVVWRGAQMKDTDLFQAKKDKKTGQPSEAGLIPALKQNGGTVTRAPDGSGIGVIPHGYQVDPSVWKDWSPTRSRAEINATTDLARGPSAQALKGGTPTYDVLIQARVSDNNGKQSILVTKVVWAPLDRSSLEAQQPEARQAKLELLMDTDDPSELAQMFPVQPKSGGLEKPAPAAELPPNPLASPSKVTWTKGASSMSQDPARPSAWQDIDLNRVPKKRG